MRCKSIGALARKFLPLLHCCLYWRLKYPFSIVAFPLQLQKSICKCLEACHAYVSIIFAGRFGPRYHSWPWRQMKEPGRFKSRVSKLLPDLHQDTKPTRYTPFKGPLILVVLNFQKMCPCSESRTNSSAKEKGAKGQKEEVEEGHALPLSQSQVIWAKKFAKKEHSRCQAGRLGNCSSTIEENAFLA